MHRAQALVCREQRIPRMSTHRQDRWPFETDGEKGMGDNSFAASCIEVTRQRIPKPGGIGHYPTFVNFMNNRFC
jgi:hypothetical protein